MNKSHIMFNKDLFHEPSNLYIGLVSSASTTLDIFSKQFNPPYPFQMIILSKNEETMEFSEISEPFPTISLEDFVEKHLSPADQKLMWEDFKKELWQEVIDKKISKIKHYRIINKLTQTELARKLNMKQPNIARLEKAGYAPDISTLKKLGEVFSINYKELL